MKNGVSLLFVAGILVCMLFVSCWKEVNPLPENPYKNVKYTTPPTPVDTLNPNSFVALQRNIFKPRCANPGCHDGTFEPDFRTAESSYASLVYHKLIKNNADSSFALRVIPFNKVKSVLYERITNCCFVNQNDRMPQDNIGVPLDANSIQAIANWIDDGAKDLFGNTPKYPNSEPQFSYYFATTPQYQVISGTNNRIDSVYYNPFIVAQNFTMNLIFAITDDSTAIENLLVNKVRFSYEPDNFSQSAPGYKQVQAYVISNPSNGDKFLMATLSTSSFNAGQVVYFRFYTNDGDHPNDTEFPYNSIQLPYKTFCSFYITP